MLRKRKSFLKTQEDLLQDELKRAKSALDTAHSNFDNALDPDLIDCYIYELKAANQRYKYLIKQAKELYLVKPDLTEGFVTQKKEKEAVTE